MMVVIGVGVEGWGGVSVIVSSVIMALTIQFKR